MAKQRVLIGTTDYSVFVKIRDDTGAPATGLAHTDVDFAYARMETDNDATTSDVAPASLSALTDAHSDWGFKEVSATDHPGLYRIDIADAVFASGAWSAVVTVTGTGLDPADMEFELVAVDDRDGVPPVDVTFWNGSAVATPTTAGVPEVDVTFWLGGAVATPTNTGVPEVDLTHMSGTILPGGTAEVNLADGAITAAKIANGAIDDATFAADSDKYTARVKINVDAGAGTPADRYIVIWYKNGQPIVSGITTPLIQVYEADADAGDLIASTAMTEIGSTQTFFYTATGAEISTPGAAYIAKLTATIGGSARTHYEPIGRDTAA